MRRLDYCMRFFKKFQCDKCEEKFSRQEELMHHELLKHCEDPRYDCKVCNEFFDSMEAMRDHLKKKHSYKNKLQIRFYYRDLNFFTAFFAKSSISSLGNSVGSSFTKCS